VNAAVESVLAEGRTVTADLGGGATTTAMTDAVLRAMERAPAPS
jgi:isocitrate/isopropylmalate dehydrogenase